MLLTVLSPLAEPMLAAAPEAKSRLFMHIVLESLCAIISFQIFSIGWQTFKTDRKWSVTLLSNLFLVVGLLCIGHLAAYLMLYLGTHMAVPEMQQKLSIFSLSIRAFSVVALLMAAGVSSKRAVSTSARIGLLTAVTAAFAIITVVAIYYPTLAPMLFVDKSSLEIRRGISIGLGCITVIAAWLFVHKLRQHHSDWLYLLLLASAMLALDRQHSHRHFHRHARWHLH